jgi:hypothetical protein
MAIPQWRYQRSIALERQHIEHGAQHDDGSTVLHFDDHLGAAYPLAGKVGEAVPGGVIERAIQGGARQAIDHIFPVK